MGGLVAFVGPVESELGSALGGGALGPVAQGRVALGAPAAEAGAGRVELWGPDGDAWALAGAWVGRAEDDAAGAALVVGDLDGDGLADLAVGSRRADTGGEDAGLVDLLFGPLTGDGSLALADATWAGAQAGDFAGGALALVDTDGLGGRGLLVGAGQVDGPAGVDCGGAWLLALPLAAGVLDEVTPMARITGPAPGALAGTALAAGDLDGDGLAEVVLGAFGWEGFAGGAWVAEGPVQGEVSLEVAPRAWLLGEASFDLAGQAVAIGDLDGDGAGELVVSVPGQDGAGSLGGAEAGVVLVFPDPRGALSAAEAAGALWGTSYARAGWDLSAAGDLDDDGHGDLVVGAPGEEDAAGGAWLVSGPVEGVRALDPSRDLRAAGAPVGAGLGDAVAGPGDLTGDGRPDLLLGAPGAATAWLWPGD
ncbi:hypothetical protein L6R53_02505 [Myxococcota bacterium]|nr:hypothetical protein [Myxococcota bacterium]